MDVNALKIDRSKQPKKRRPRAGGGRSWLVPVVVLAILVGAGFLFRDTIGAFLDRYRLPEVRIERVVLSHPATVGAVSGTAANGHVVAARRAALSADTPGRIVELNVTEGSVVKKGDVVARLYADEYEAALRRAEADLASADASVARADANLEAAGSDVARTEKSLETARAEVSRAQAEERLARQRFERARDLAKQEAGSLAAAQDAEARYEAAKATVASSSAALGVAQASVTDAKNRAEVARADIRVAKSRIDIARATRDQARATLDKTYVRAPFDGIVVLKDAEVGEVVSPNSFGGSQARGAVCTMVDFDSLEVQADVPETSLGRVQLQARVNIYLDAYPRRVYKGRVSRIWPTADRQQATIEVRVTFDERDDLLRPDMGVRVVFLSEGAETDPVAEATATKRQPKILVSESAVVEADGKSGVFVLERDTVRFQSVEVGDRRAGRVTIESGLRDGQKILVEPPARLESGDRVRIARS